MKNALLLILIFAVIFVVYKACSSDENYRPFVTLYGTNPIRQRRSGWRNYWGEACPYGNQGCPNCPGCPFQPSQTPQGGYPTTGGDYYRSEATGRGGMYTSTYGDVCSRYGSNNLDVDASTYYMGSRWCPVGVVMNQVSPDKVSSTQALEARFLGNSWSFRVRDGVSGMYVYLNTVGQGPYGAYRDGDLIPIPGKPGDWKAQIQTQYQPYLLYLPF